MKKNLPDIKIFEENIFKKKNVLSLLLQFSLELMEARQAGLLLGTNASYQKFLSPEKWDRGVMHKFYGTGRTGFLLKYFGPVYVRLKGLSPVLLYKDINSGKIVNNEGIISYVLRTHKDFYKNGLKILIIKIEKDKIIQTKEPFVSFPVFSFDGEIFKSLEELKVNISIAKQFKSKNFISAYIPDYGALVFNTIDEKLLQKDKKKSIYSKDLKSRLNNLISAIEMTSLSYIGQARGRQAAHVIWRKEKFLRKTAKRLIIKEDELEDQKAYLRAVGGVTEKQLNMEPVLIKDGVYSFVDMVGSATIRKKYNPKDFFFMLNICNQIAAINAAYYSCRLGNFIGDSVFFQCVSPFDSEDLITTPGTNERTMLMVLLIASIFSEFRKLKNGDHILDKEAKVKRLLESQDTKISFRAGIEIGDALIGPVGGHQRKIVTAIGQGVNNASRLESTGVAQYIHFGEDILNILKSSFINKETKILYKIFLDKGYKGSFDSDNSIPFLGYYKKHFKLDADLITQRENIHYKEFSRDVTFLLKCIPDNI